MMYDTAIIGGGIAGYSAALTAKNLQLHYLWLAQEAFSEKTRRAEYVRNLPAFTGSGTELCGALEAQRQREGVVLTQRRVDGVYRTGGGYILTCADEQFEARTVILATGVETHRIAGASELVGRGVSYCAVCDGALYRDKEIAAVLYDKKFVPEVEFLASYAKTVHCFCPEPFSFRAQNTVVHCDKVEAVEGRERVESVVTKSGAVAVDGVFLLLESVPPSSLVGGLRCEGERVLTDRSLATNLKGLYAAGDITGRPYQYAKAAGEGLIAAYSVLEYLRERENA